MSEPVEGNVREQGADTADVLRTRTVDELRAALAAYDEMDEANPNHPDPDSVILDAHASPEELRTLLAAQPAPDVAGLLRALDEFFEDVDADWSNDNLRPGTFAFRFRAAADRLRTHLPARSTEEDRT